MTMYRVSGKVTISRRMDEDWSSPLIEVQRSIPEFLVDARNSQDAERIARSVVLTIGEPRGVNYLVSITVHDTPPKHLQDTPTNGRI